MREEVVQLTTALSEKESIILSLRRVLTTSSSATCDLKPSVSFHQSPSNERVTDSTVHTPVSLSVSTCLSSMPENSNCGTPSTLKLTGCSHEVESPILSTHRDSLVKHLPTGFKPSPEVETFSSEPIEVLNQNIDNVVFASASFYSSQKSNESHITPVKDQRRKWLDIYIKTPTKLSPPMQWMSNHFKTSNTSALMRTHISAWSPSASGTPLNPSKNITIQLNKILHFSHFTIGLTFDLNNYQRAKLCLRKCINFLKTKLKYIIVFVILGGILSLQTQVMYPHGHIKELGQSSSNQPYMLLEHNHVTAPTVSPQTPGTANIFKNWFAPRPSPHLSPRHFLITLDAEESDSELDIATKLYEQISKISPEFAERYGRDRSASIDLPNILADNGNAVYDSGVTEEKFRRMATIRYFVTGLKAGVKELRKNIKHTKEKLKGAVSEFFFLNGDLVE